MTLYNPDLASPAVVRGLNVPIAPVPLPQDKLAVPGFPLFDPYSNREEVDRYNSTVTKQEFYVYSGSFLTVAQTGGVTLSQVLGTDPDGDFWMTSLVMETYLSGTTNSVIIPGYVQITDTRTNYSIFDPQGVGSVFPLPLGTQISFFRARVPPPGSSLTLAKTPIIQPYCFTRDGAIRVTLTLPNKPGGGSNFDIWFALIGWKEYKQAAGARVSS